MSAGSVSIHRSWCSVSGPHLHLDPYSIFHTFYLYRFQYGKEANFKAMGSKSSDFPLSVFVLIRVKQTLCNLASSPPRIKYQGYLVGDIVWEAPFEHPCQDNQAIYYLAPASPKLQSIQKLRDYHCPLCGGFSTNFSRFKFHLSLIWPS